MRPRLSRIHYSGRFFDYPLKAVNALAGLGPVEAMLILLSYAKAKTSARRRARTMGSRTALVTVCTIFSLKHTEKVWGIPCTEISADWAVQRIKNLSLREAVRNALLRTERAQDGQIVTTLIDQFHYPRFGPGMMWERCEELLAAQGCHPTWGVCGAYPAPQHGRVECVYGRTSGGEKWSSAATSDLYHAATRTYTRVGPCAAR